MPRPYPDRFVLILADIYGSPEIPSRSAWEQRLPKEKKATEEEAAIHGKTLAENK
ncbi:Rapamycin-insensitive companion of mTOR [Anopheles sinensis]|uniref:Rapamycin-insensitive companion of mTOR n=1 Tax=Anopheles sinensis TaxID=74873 RepID=A0A084VKS9_ANOSI|nr:Rapamycin-insensitive companion of mTOR [Anopheles sinensis]